jgi:16S rRNA processing protein RimM
MTKFVSIGKVLNFHGIQGEAKVGFSNQDFFCGLKEVFVGTDPMKITRIRIHKNAAIVKFEGIDSIDELMPYKGALLFVPEQALKESLDDDEFLVGELVGLDVVTDDKKSGIVTGVSNNGATDLLSVKTKSGKVCLVPFVKAIVTDVDMEAKTVTINNIEGLLE